MSQDDWYRSECWTSEIEAVFNARLARSRGQRSEYLRIQALTLVETGKCENALPAIQLATRQLELKEKNIFAAQMHAIIANAYVVLGNTSAAIEAFRYSVEAERNRPYVHGYHYLEFAWFVATNRLVEFYDETIRVIDQNKQDQDLMLPVNQYRFFGALALISEGREEQATTQRLAKSAIQAAERNAGPFRHQPKLGLFRAKRDDILSRLEQLVDG